MCVLEEERVPPEEDEGRERARGKKSEKERLGIPILVQDILSWNRPGVNNGMAKSGAHSSLMFM
jgi:hypothetical protein